MIHLENIKKKYLTADGEITVLNIRELVIEAGSSAALVGPSGSGKSTLLNLLAGLDTPTSGSINIGHQRIDSLTENERTKFRLQNIGFIFQSFRLLDNLTALENVSVPGELLGNKAISQRANRLLNDVGLSHRASHFPAQLSGGEQQRVAIARAFMSEPKIILADEPTGNLDGGNGERIQELLLNLNTTTGTTLLVATHDLNFASKLLTQHHLKNGELV